MDIIFLRFLIYRILIDTVAKTAHIYDSIFMIFIFTVIFFNAFYLLFTPWFTRYEMGHIFEDITFLIYGSYMIFTFMFY